MRPIHRRAQIRAPITMRPHQLHHRIPIIITSARTITRSMIRNPSLRGIRTLKERIMPGAVVPIRARKDTPVMLAPRARTHGVRDAVPR